MGGDSHGHHDHHHHHLAKIPDYKIYKVEDVPELALLKEKLAARGLKDPWLRNEVWRFMLVEPRTRKARIQRVFKGFIPGFGLFAATVIGELVLSMVGKKDGGHGGHGGDGGHAHPKESGMSGSELPVESSDLDEYSKNRLYDKTRDFTQDNKHFDKTSDSTKDQSSKFNDGSKTEAEPPTPPQRTHAEDEDVEKKEFPNFPDILDMLLKMFPGFKNEPTEEQAPQSPDPEAEIKAEQGPQAFKDKETGEETKENKQNEESKQKESTQQFDEPVHFDEFYEIKEDFGRMGKGMTEEEKEVTNVEKEMAELSDEEAFDKEIEKYLEEHLEQIGRSSGSIHEESSSQHEILETEDDIDFETSSENIFEASNVTKEGKNSHPEYFDPEFYKPTSSDEGKKSFTKNDTN